jgi:NAD(P)-dependent dehydrogenase (short-subunit alcohol dehydrogenase family)
MTKVIVVIGSGSIGQAIARRVGAGRHVLLADLRRQNADAAARTLGEAGFEVTTTALISLAGSALQAREFAARHVRGRPVAGALRADQHDQPRHYHDSTGQGLARPSPAATS